VFIKAVVLQEVCAEQVVVCSVKNAIAVCKVECTKFSRELKETMCIFFKYTRELILVKVSKLSFSSLSPQSFCLNLAINHEDIEDVFAP